MNIEDSKAAWKKIKDYYNCKTTEEIFGINNPVEHQCSFIDKIKDKVGTIELEAEVRKRDEDDIEVLSDKLYSIRHEVYGLEDEIEEIRTRIEEVRKWGSQWKDLCKKIILKHNLDISEIG